MTNSMVSVDVIGSTRQANGSGGTECGRAPSNGTRHRDRARRTK